jgi:hypothetical protein
MAITYLYPTPTNASGVLSNLNSGWNIVGSPPATEAAGAVDEDPNFPDLSDYIWSTDTNLNQTESRSNDGINFSITPGSFGGYPSDWGVVTQVEVEAYLQVIGNVDDDITIRFAVVTGSSGVYAYENTGFRFSSGAFEGLFTQVLNPNPTGTAGADQWAAEPTSQQYGGAALIFVSNVAKNMGPDNPEMRVYSIRLKVTYTPTVSNHLVKVWDGATWAVATVRHGAGWPITKLSYI